MESLQIQHLITACDPVRMAAYTTDEIRIKLTGLSVGERLYEELAGDGEKLEGSLLTFDEVRERRTRMMPEYSSGSGAVPSA